jgi:NADH-quinone oxidoreductase subunit N
MISLGYYLPVIAAMWMREAPAQAGRPPSGQASPTAPLPGALPALAGGSPELDDEPLALAGAPRTGGAQWELVLLATVMAGATIFFGVIPQPLFELVNHAGSALGGLFSM